MFLTCCFSKIKPEIEVMNIVKTVLSDKQKAYAYRTFDALDSKLELYLFINNCTPSQYGSLTEIYFEDVQKFRKIDPDGQKLKTVYEKIAYGPIFTILYEKDPLLGVMGILASHDVSNKLLSAISRVIEKKMGSTSRVFTRVLFNIFMKQKEIRSIPDFADVVEIVVENVADQYVDWANIKGSMLDQSEEYKKYVEGPARGRLKVLAVRFQNRVYYLYYDGRIFTREADVSDVAQIVHEVGLFYEMVKRLQQVNAVIM